MGSDPSADGAAAADALTSLVQRARRGFRRDVEALSVGLAEGRLLVPLRHAIADVEVGIEVEAGDSLRLSPHLLMDEDEIGYVPLFSRPAFVERIGDLVDWRTDEGPLEYCALPGRVALEIALEAIDGERVRAALVNAGDESELMLRRHEATSLAQGRAVPLVGYVSEIPFSDDESVLIAETEAHHFDALEQAAKRVLGEFSPTPEFVIRQTFNAERDLDPHPTLNVLGVEEAERTTVATALGAGLEGHVPDPGYIDIVFDDPRIR